MIRILALVAVAATLSACARTEPVATGFPVMDKSGAVIGMTSADGTMMSDTSALDTGTAVLDTEESNF